MRLLRLSVSGFRNLPTAVIDLDAPLVALVGSNGQGKTNWLEAAGIIGTLRSFRTARAAELITWGQSRAEVEALVRSDDMVRRLSWSFGAGTRTLRRDERNIDALAWLSSFRATYFVPGDVAPIRGEPALRRALLDRAILAADPSYLVLARDYKRVLEHKAALLKANRASEMELDVLDAQLAPLGAAVTEARSRVLVEIQHSFSSFYEKFGADESATVAYEPWLGVGDRTELTRRYAEALGRQRSKERSVGRPLGGPHRDDLAFLIRGHSARAYASQGQARSLVLAWKLAELAFARSAGESPLFLMDDLGSELDPGRTSRLVALLGSLGVQILLSTTDRRFVPREAVSGEVRTYTVREGGLEPGAEPGYAG